MQKMSVVVYALTAIGIAGMIWRAGTITSIPIYWISKGAVFTGTCALAIGMACGILPYGREFKSIVQRYRFTLALLITPFIGLAWSSILGFGWGAYLPLIRFEYIRILFVCSLFCITAYGAIGNKKFVRHIFAVIAISCIPLWLSLNSSWKLFPLAAGRLTGTGNDSNFLAAWITVALIGAAVFFLWEKGTARWAWLTGIFVITPLLVWTISRAAWLTAIITAFGVLALFFKNGHLKKHYIDPAILIGTLTASLICGFLLFPPLSRVVIVIRSLAPFVNHERLVHTIEWTAPQDTIRKEDFPTAKESFGIADELLVTVNNNRGWLWREGIQWLIRTPLGFGPAYYFWHPIGIEGLWIQHKLNAHNVWLDIGLSSGWLGLAIFLLFIYRILQNAFSVGWRENPESIAIAASLLMLLFLGSFMDIFTQPILWIVAGLIAGSAAPATTNARKERSD